MNVCFTCDGNYLRALEVAVLSLLENSSKEICLHIVKCSDFSESTLVDICSSYNVKLNFYLFMPQLEAVGRFTPSVYARLYLDEILSVNIDKILYLDCDLIIEGDLSALYENDLKEFFLSAVKDNGDEYIDQYCVDHDLDSYFNAGMMLLNMKKMRNEGIFSKSRNSFNKDNKYLDQDMMNLAVKNNWLEVNEFYNYMGASKSNQAVVVHYAHCKPWETFSFNKNSDRYFYYENKLDTDTSSMRMAFNLRRIIRNLVLYIKGEYL